MACVPSSTEYYICRIVYYILFTAYGNNCQMINFSTMQSEVCFGSSLHVRQFSLSLAMLIAIFAYVGIILLTAAVKNLFLNMTICLQKLYAQNPG